MAALFRAFQNIYADRSRDLYRIATGGTGKLPDGDLHPDLVNRLAVEAAKSARHILTMCIRALDYVPPVDITFGEYLRALITADYDLVRDDDLGYRVAVIDAFRSWGIYPPDVNVLDETALLWSPPAAYERNELRGLLGKLTLHRTGHSERTVGPSSSRWTKAGASSEPGSTTTLARRRMMSRHARGIDPWERATRASRGTSGGSRSSRSTRSDPAAGSDPTASSGSTSWPISFSAVRGTSTRLSRQRSTTPTTPWLFFPKDDNHKKPRDAPPRKPDFWFRGGCSLIIDAKSGDIRYCVSKSVLNDDRLDAKRNFDRTGTLPSAFATYFGSRDRNPFALLHTTDD